MFPGHCLKIINHQFAAIIERNRIVTKTREFLRNAAVDGDGCMHFYFDPTIENGQEVKGEICAEIIENTRVLFGNPNCRDVQRQPYIIIPRRELVEDVRYRAELLKEDGFCKLEDVDIITPDSEKYQNKYDSYTDDKVTVLTYYFRNRDTKTIWCIEATEKGIIREAYDTEYTMYPLVWINWDYIHDCYHGQAMITGLLPNQKFINKIFAMVGISLLTTAFPKKALTMRIFFSRWKWVGAKPTRRSPSVKPTTASTPLRTMGSPNRKHPTPGIPYGTSWMRLIRKELTAYDQ